MRLRNSARSVVSSSEDEKKDVASEVTDEFQDMKETIETGDLGIDNDNNSEQIDGDIVDSDTGSDVFMPGIVDTKEGNDRKVEFKCDEDESQNKDTEMNETYEEENFTLPPLLNGNNESQVIADDKTSCSVAAEHQSDGEQQIICTSSSQLESELEDDKILGDRMNSEIDRVLELNEISKETTDCKDELISFPDIDTNSNIKNENCYNENKEDVDETDIFNEGNIFSNPDIFYENHSASEKELNPSDEYDITDYKLDGSVHNSSGHNSGSGNQSEEDEGPSEPPSFEVTETNIYLIDKKRSRSNKDIRRMTCECPFEPDDPLFIGCDEYCLNRLLMIECNKHCPTGEFCTNRNFQKGCIYDLEIIKAGKKGWGLKSNETISKGAFIIEYCGEVVDYADFHFRTQWYYKEGITHYYFMTLKTNEIIDATKKGSISRFINHSCDPNCVTQKWTVNGFLRVGFFALRHIKPGEELSFDYQFQRYGEKPQTCYCGASCCRGVIGTEQIATIPTYIEKCMTNTSSKKKGKGGKETKKLKEFYDSALAAELKELLGDKWVLTEPKQTLELVRLMVKTETFHERRELLKIMQASADTPALKSFVRYKGLDLLWSWMIDASSESRIKYRYEILKTLKHIPIRNKNELDNSKLIGIVSKWAIPAVDSTSENLSDDDNQSACSDDAPNDGGSSSQDDSSKEDDIECDKKKSLLADSMEEGEILDDDEVDNKKVKKKNKGKKKVSCEKVKKREKELMRKRDVASLAQALLDDWKLLKEVFRIPKKIRIPDQRQLECDDSPLQDEKRPREKTTKFSPAQSSETFGDGSLFSKPTPDSTYSLSNKQIKMLKEVTTSNMHISGENELTSSGEEQNSSVLDESNDNLHGRNKTPFNRESSDPRFSKNSNRADDFSEQSGTVDSTSNWSGDSYDYFQNGNKIENGRRQKRGKGRRRSYEEDRRNWNDRKEDVTDNESDRNRSWDENFRNRGWNGKRGSRHNKDTPNRNAFNGSENRDTGFRTEFNRFGGNRGNFNELESRDIGNHEHFSGLESRDIINNRGSFPAAENRVLNNFGNSNIGENKNMVNHGNFNAGDNVDIGGHRTCNMTDNRGIVNHGNFNETANRAISNHVTFNGSDDNHKWRNNTNDFWPRPPPPKSLLPVQQAPRPTFNDIPSSQHLPPNIPPRVDNDFEQSRNTMPNQQQPRPLYPPPTGNPTNILNQPRPPNIMPPRMPNNMMVPSCPPPYLLPPPPIPPHPLNPQFNSMLPNQIQKNSPLVTPMPTRPYNPISVSSLPTSDISQSYPNNSARYHGQAQPEGGSVMNTVQQMPVSTDHHNAIDFNRSSTSISPPPSSSASPSRSKPVPALPPHWKTATDSDGRVYYYHSITRETSWEPPIQSDDLDTAPSSPPVSKRRKNSAESSPIKYSPRIAAADTTHHHGPRTPPVPQSTSKTMSSAELQKIRDTFKSKMSSVVVNCLNSYQKVDCKQGRIKNVDDFKFLARKLTHGLIMKEIQRIKNEELLVCNDSVKVKVKEYIRNYMKKFGVCYIRS